MKGLIVVLMSAVLPVAGHAEPGASSESDSAVVAVGDAGAEPRTDDAAPAGESADGSDDGVPAVGESGAVEVPVGMLVASSEDRSVSTTAEAKGKKSSHKKDDPDEKDFQMLKKRMEKNRNILVKHGQIKKDRSTWQTNESGDRVCAEQADFLAGELEGKNISGYVSDANDEETRKLMKPEPLPKGYKVKRKQNRNIASYVPVPTLQEKEVQHRWVEVETPRGKTVTLDPWANKAQKGEAPPDYARKGKWTRATTIRQELPPVDLPTLDSVPPKHHHKKSAPAPALPSSVDLSHPPTLD